MTARGVGQQCPDLVARCGCAFELELGEELGVLVGTRTLSGMFFGTAVSSCVAIRIQMNTNGCNSEDRPAGRVTGGAGAPASDAQANSSSGIAALARCDARTRARIRTRWRSTSTISTRTLRCARPSSRGCGARTRCTGTRRTASGYSRAMPTCAPASKQPELFSSAAEGPVACCSTCTSRCRHSMGPSIAASAASHPRDSRRAWCGACARPRTRRSTPASTRSPHRAAASS